MKNTVSRSSLPRDYWGRFLEAYSRRHRGWLIQLETHDLETDERVLSQEMLLDSIELDLEDEKNPRINITVHSGNKVIKHILFLPSQLVVDLPDDQPEQTIHVDTLNTQTIIHVSAPIR